MRLRKILIFLCVIGTCFYSGCTSRPVEPSDSLAEPSEQHTPHQTENTQPSAGDLETGNTDDSGTSPTAAIEDFELDFLGIPLIYINRTGEDAGSVYQMAWNLEDGTLTEPSFIYHQSGNESDYILNTMSLLWTGNRFFLGPAQDVESIDGIVYTSIDRAQPIVHYGRAYYSNTTNRLHYLSDENRMEEIKLPSVPDSVYDSRLLVSEPKYATVIEDKVFVAFYCYQSWAADGTPCATGDLIYTSYPLSDPSSAKWKVVTLTSEMSPSVLAFSDAALIEEKMYIPSATDLLILDIETGEIAFAGLPEQLNQLCGDKTNTYPGAFQENVRIIGWYRGILVMDIPLYDADGLLYSYVTAYKDGAVLGVQETNANDLTRIIYDAELNIVDTSDAFLQFPTIRFPKDS